ncbi:MAG: hypothetical protein JWR75_582 [Devosia sp.]|nr:hypothetical protein [Devosia sp.]
MSKPDPKEPSMDEILSSIRQIIADDDASGSPRRPAPVQPAPMQAAEYAPRVPMYAEAVEIPQPAALPPLTLSATQILRDEPAQYDSEPEIEATSFEIPELEIEPDPEPELYVPSEPELVDPDDIAFDLDLGDPEPVPPPVATYTPQPRFAASPEPFTPPPSPPRPSLSIAQAAPMPDPDLSRDMAERLLGPATDAAVRSNFTRLSGIAMGNGGVTLEAMVREMMRPMLKDWLDENLPAVVERMVEKEIARVSRGISD